jgi:stage V sporulation protein T
MKATGIVRRMDDLGRVVIPKELRRSMRIKEGAALEIFTHNGAICFKPYSPVGEKDWEKAKALVEVLLGCDFALLDAYGNVEIASVEGYKPLNQEFGIVVEGETIGFLAVNEDEAKEYFNHAIPQAIAILQKLFADAV